MCPDPEDYFVYAIQSQKDGRVYIGLSKNPVSRLKEHNAGETKSTKGFRPWLLIFKETCNSRAEARELEKYYKTSSGRRNLKKKLHLA